MTEFLTPTDIGNRALQRVGSEMMSTTLGFAEPSKRAQQVSFCYGKLRRAELERNTWSFATRRCMLRAIDTNSMLLAPTLFNTNATYFVGSLVTDGSGNIWQSRIPNNTGNDPQNTAMWEPYFGPMSVDPYDSTQTYYAGEIVYTAPGDGTYNVYLSMISANNVDPSLPNFWSTSTTYFKNDVVQVYPAWSSGTTYSQGQTVLYTDGNWYSSLVNSNLNHIPSSSTTQWALVPALVLQSLAVPVTSALIPPLSTPVGEWSQTTTYSIGTFVMFKGTEYVSIANNNTGNYPNAAASTFWAALSGGTNYMSMIDLNTGNNPSSSPALWASGTTYAAGQSVCGSDGTIYTSIGNGNLGHDPTLTTGFWTNTGVLCPWTTIFTQGAGNPQWTQIGGSSFPYGVALAELNIVYPLGAGPSAQSQTRNIYRLPNGFLKMCSQDPKAGAVSYLGAEFGLPYKDWLIERPYLVSQDVGPIMLRYVCDVTDVTLMNTMFCEGLACRIALEVCEPLTQSTTKVATIAREYEKFMGEARTTNAIETGSEQPPMDDFIEARY
ncbi:MAG TPA: hypothetical protein VMU34_10540 [Mycobacterium sp.]|nr:hypothetical protein [Mycobacterium sp.]